MKKEYIDLVTETLLSCFPQWSDPGPTSHGDTWLTSDHYCYIIINISSHISSSRYFQFLVLLLHYGLFNYGPGLKFLISNPFCRQLAAIGTRPTTRGYYKFFFYYYKVSFYTKSWNWIEDNWNWYRKWNVTLVLSSKPPPK